MVSEDRAFQSTGCNETQRREQLIAQLARTGVARDEVLKAMSRVPRHHFIDAAMADRAYDDAPLPIEDGQTISQPYIVARMTDLVMAEGTPRKVLEIGTGSGYQAAILAELMEMVYTVERLDKLQKQAQTRLAEAGYHNIHAYKAQEGEIGLPAQAPFDVILVTAGARHFPEALLEQLAGQGRLIIPLEDKRAGQRLVVVQRQGQGYTRQDLEAVRFVPLVRAW